MRITFYAGLCLALAACATGYLPRVQYSYLMVANHTGDTINNVELQIGADGRNLRCDSVTPNRICDERFGRRNYPHQAIIMSWQDSSGESKSTQLDPRVPAYVSSGKPQQLLFRIKEDDSVEFEFRSDTLSLKD